MANSKIRKTAWELKKQKKVEEVEIIFKFKENGNNETKKDIVGRT